MDDVSEVLTGVVRLCVCLDFTFEGGPVISLQCDPVCQGLSACVIAICFAVDFL